MYSTVLAWSLLTVARAEGRAVASEQAACEALKRRAVEFCLSRTDLTGRYFCDPLPEDPSYYNVGLRYEVKPDELVGSNLIDWYAVRKSDGEIFVRDVADDHLSPLVARCPFERE
jgi:hypothetical protein